MTPNPSDKQGNAATTIACIGAGPIGRSWARLFRAHGHDVRLFDLDSSTLAAAAAAADAIPVPCLADAVTGADLVFECIAERLDRKRELCEALDGLMEPRTIFVSSSSAIPISLTVTGRSFAGRSLVAHPFNPPDIVPLVEVVPAPFTEEDAVVRVMGLLVACGRKPVRLHREVTGFVGNRLAMALYREALHLIAVGVIDVDDLDTVVSEGLGPRWACVGPSETYHLNQDASFAGYFARIDEHLAELAGSLSRSASLDARGIAAVADHQDRNHEPVPRRRERRNALLLRILTAKTEAEGDIASDGTPTPLERKDHS